MSEKADHEYVRGLSRGRVVMFLEKELGIVCYDHESRAELAAALIANIDDGTTSRYDVEQYMELINTTLRNANDKLTDFEKEVLRMEGV